MKPRIKRKAVLMYRCTPDMRLIKLNTKQFKVLNLYNLFK